MQIVGDGFIAGWLSDGIGDRHPAATVLAAGVSGTGVTSADAFDREAQLVYDTLDACGRQDRLMVFLSTASMAMYGSPPVPAREDDPVRPPSVYGRHKLALEAVVRGSGIAYLVLRLSHVVGPGQRPHQLLPTLVRQVRQGQVTVLDGAHRDLLDVRDLVLAVDVLLAADVRGRVLNVASGVPQPIGAVVDAIERRVGVSADRDHRAGAGSRTPVDTSRLRTLVPDFAAGAPDAAGYLDLILDHYLRPTHSHREQPL